MNLHIAQEEKITLKEVISQEGQAKKIAQQKLDEMEKYISTVFRTIPKITESQGVSSKGKMRKIAQALE
jgi:hypothetical protein